MSDLVEARDVDGQLYVSAVGLTKALDKAREQGKEIERAKWMGMLTPLERRMMRVREACVEGGVDIHELMTGRGRDPKVVKVRQRLFHEFREEGMSLPDIGRFFKRDHTTVLYGIHKERERRNEMDNRTGSDEPVIQGGGCDVEGSGS